MQTIFYYRFFISPSFNPIFTMFMQNKFLLVANYIFCSPPLHINKKNTETYPLHSYTFPPENQLLHSLKRVLLPPYPSPYFYPSNTQNPPFYKALKENNPKKEQKKKRTFSYNKKNYHKKTWCLCKYTMFQDTLKPA